MMKKIIIILAAMAVLASCAKEPVTGTTLTADGLVSIDFGVTIPGSPTVSTKGVIGETGTINSLTVAVFGSSGNLVEQAKALPVVNGTPGQDGDAFVQGSDGKYHFNVTLHATDGETHVHFIAGDHEPITPGSENNVMGNLMTKSRQEDGKYVFPDSYWRRVVVPGGIHGPLDADGKPATDPSQVVTPATKFQDVALIRNSVKISLAVSGDAAKKFAPTGYELVRVPLNTHTALYWDGQFLDDYQNDSDHGYDWVKNFYSGGGWMNPGYLEDIPSDQDDDNGMNNVRIDRSAYQSTSPKYMYQRSVVSGSSTYLIVKGTYKEDADATGQTCYYKINLADADDRLMPLYRNFHYIYTITDIAVKGEETPYKASQSNGSGGVTVGVVTRYDTEVPIGDNKLLLGWSENTVNHEDYLELESDVNGRYLLLPVQYSVKEGNSYTTHNDQIYLKDARGRVFYAGSNSSKTLDVTVNGTVPSDESKVFSKADITGQNIKLYMLELSAGHAVQSFTVNVGDFHRTVTVHSLYELQLGIQCLNNVSGSANFGTTVVETGLDKSVKVKVLLDQALPSALFPMDLYIYVKNNSLSPVPGSDLVVGTGADKNSSTGTYYFRKTLSYEDYLNTNLCPIENYKVTVPLDFKTSKENSGSVVGVRTEKAAQDAWTEFYNPSVSGQFSDVRFTGYESVVPKVGASLTLSFATSSITTVDVILPPNLEPADDYMADITGIIDLSAYPEGSKAYSLSSVTSGTHTVALKTAQGYQTSQNLVAYVSSVSAGYTSQDIVQRTASLHAVDVDVDVDVAFTRNNFSNATPSLFTGTGNNYLTVSLSRGRPGRNENYTEMRRYSGTFVDYDDTISLTSNMTITGITFVMSQNQLGVTSDTGTMSTTSSGNSALSWNGRAKSIRLSGTDSDYSKTNRFTSMKVHILGAHFVAGTN